MDPIANMISTIRNGIMAGKDFVVVGESKIKLSICKILLDKKIIAEFSPVSEENKKMISIKLNSDQKQYHLKMISKPGRRMYIKSKNIKAPLSGLGFYIISSPFGLVTDREARKLGTGGELICEVW